MRRGIGDVGELASFQRGEPRPGGRGERLGTQPPPRAPLGDPRRTSAAAAWRNAYLTGMLT
ncbi:hypothetical protein F4560_003155 [Saccharothrix ecbatanensis]|uniref:Uncharacterized protein n=1 Tax=Saccharothrix ecbatanensis TaxID=1105145 RepID=A0A7W9HJE4_9PSEU|nr:hypothetical protein [Saccharothrix ecbatanensis]MBB5803387.1 hypothetical protein [Saccharothrix ecbatanensis]